MPATKPAPFNPSPRVLLGPGPSEVPPRVLAAMGYPLLGHLDPEFVALMDETQALLRQVFRTENRLTMAVSGTGSAGMEAVVVNLIEPGDRMLVCVNGVFGSRMVDVAQRAGAEVTAIERPYGQVFDPERGPCRRQEDQPEARRHRPRRDVDGGVAARRGDRPDRPRRRLHDRHRHRHVAGRRSRRDRRLGHRRGLLRHAEVPELPARPGSRHVQRRAAEVIANRKIKVQSWYLDMQMIQKYWGGDRVYHHTAPISMNYALREALALVVEEGLEARHARHKHNSDALKAGLAAMGIGIATAEGHRLPQLTCARIPEGIDDMAVRKRLLADWGIEIGGGLGEFKGKAWRIGLMGHGSRPANVTLFLAALETCLRDLGARVEPGAALAAASAVYRKSSPA